jgi:glycosyltransferase involved in cell wall biosynthesis
MRVLQLSTHSTLLPRYGGQLRSHHIGRCLENACIEVSRIAVCWPNGHDLQDKREPIIDLSLSPFWTSGAFLEAEPWGSYLFDYYSAIAVAETPALMNELREHIALAAPDVILLEHPWTWPLVKTLPGLDTDIVRVVYSSHNVETLLKRRMIDDARLKVPGEVLDGVEALEHDLVASAWATVACTPADAEIFRSWGADRVVVANNGAVFKSRDNLVSALPVPLDVQHRFGLFIGSNYLPNINGFFRYIAPALWRLRPHQRIVIAGTVCEPINVEIALSPVRHYQDGRLVSLGFVDDMTLNALIANAAALLLPIEYGGGSHLKTAEALASGRPIVGTGASFRGFTEYQDLPRVSIADTPEEFEAALQELLSTPAANNGDFALPREVLWESTLDPLVELIRSCSN